MSNEEIIFIGGQYDEHEKRFTIKSPYGAKADIESLDRFVTGRKWDSYFGAWTIRATRESVRHTAIRLESCGWTVKLSDPAEAVKCGTIQK